MEELLTLLGEYIATEIDGVKDVEYAPKDEGYVLIVIFDSGRRVKLTLS